MTDMYKNEQDKWNELIAWEDKNNIVSFLMISSDDVRDYYGDDRFKDFSDEEIFENLMYVARKIDLHDELHFVVDEICEMMEEQNHA